MTNSVFQVSSAFVANRTAFKAAQLPVVGTIVTRDFVAGVEWAANLLRDSTEPVDWVVTRSGDQVCFAEWNTFKQNDTTASVEWKSIQQRDAVTSIDELGSSIAGIVGLAELRSTTQADTLDMPEWGFGQFRDGSGSAEWRGAIQVNNVIPAEWENLVGLSGAAIKSTWNASDKDTAITLTSGNTIATANTASETGVRSTSSNNSGKYYCEFTAQAAMSSAVGFGIANSSWSFTGINGIGGDANSMAWSTLGVVYVNNASIGTASLASASGTVLCMAIDLTAGLVWWRVNGGNWNNDPTANPTTGVNGFSMTGLGSGPFFAAFGTNGSTTDSVLFNGSAPFVQTQPSSFAAWDGAGGGNPIPLEWGTTSFSFGRNDSVAIEWRSTQAFDTFVPADWRGTLLADSPTAAEWGTSRLLDNAAPDEWRGALQVDRANPAEWGQSAQLSTIIPAEWILSVVGTATIPAEWGLSARVDYTAPIEPQSNLQRDATAPVEWRASWTRDTTAPFDWLTSLQTDRTAPIEWITSFVGISYTVPAEWGLSGQLSATAPLEFSLSLQFTTPISVDWRGSVLADMPTAAEWRGTFIRDSTVPIDWTSPVAGYSTTAPIEFGTTVFADRVVPATWNDSILSNASVFIEFAGATGTIRDDNVSIEWRATPVFDNTASVEWRASLQIDRSAPVESLTTATRDAATPSEWGLSVVGNASINADWKATLQRDSTAAADWGGTIQEDATAAVEWSRSFSQDTASGFYFLASTLTDMPTAVEWAGAVGVTGNALMQIEWTQTRAFDGPSGFYFLATPKSDQTVPGEWGGAAGVTRDALIAVDWLATTRADVIAAEASALSLQTDRIAPAEWSATTATVIQRDAGIPLEWASSIAASQVMILAIQGSSVADVSTGAEWTSTTQIDVVILNDHLFSTYGSVAGPTEWKATLAPDTVAMVEWGVTTHTIQADSRFPLEFSMSATATVAMPADWGSTPNLFHATKGAATTFIGPVRHLQKGSQLVMPTKGASAKPRGRGR